MDARSPNSLDSCPPLLDKLNRPENNEDRELGREGLNEELPLIEVVWTSLLLLLLPLLLLLFELLLLALLVIFSRLVICAVIVCRCFEIKDFQLSVLVDSRLGESLSVDTSLGAAFIALSISVGSNSVAGGGALLLPY